MEKGLGLDIQAVEFVCGQLKLAQSQIKGVLNLLVMQECTVPFVARYRKDQTGNLDEVALREIHNAYLKFLEVKKRRDFILSTLKKRNQLDTSLEKKLNEAQTLNVLEDIYAPFKAKRKNKAQTARSAGLEKLATIIKTATDKAKEQVQSEIERLLALKIANFETSEQILNGAKDIIVFEMAQDQKVKEIIRRELWRKGKITSKKAPKAESIKDYLKYKDFFEHSEFLEGLKDKKSSHRFLAVQRGAKSGVLKIDIDSDSSSFFEFYRKEYFSNEKLGCTEIIQDCARKAVSEYVGPSLENEVKRDLKDLSDQHAIYVFGVNLKNLMLRPYLGPQIVMGIDPGIKSGCKVVVIGETGKLLADFVIHLEGPKKDQQSAKILLDSAIDHFKIPYIAIGNGTYGRETLQFIQSQCEKVKNGEVKATTIFEQGASVYSASELARTEFPDKDVTVRGAVSIARRFQDPLAELVKIDPKSIGVGQYQHDVNQTQLKQSLCDVVEDCVNYVGVDLNTASAPLLAYISGIGPVVADNIVKHRQKYGNFKIRAQLLKVPKLGDKAYQMCAGFLRIYGGKNPLDGTFIHPEHYPTLLKWCESNNVVVEELVDKKQVLDTLSRDEDLKTQLGPHTFDDIVAGLKAPSQDPRQEFKSVDFDPSVKSIEDLKVGSWYTGVVSNRAQFGHFIDLGIKESGLLHVSELGDGFVKNPLDALKIGQEIKVRIKEVDLERKRISLSCRNEDKRTKRPDSTKGERSLKGEKMRPRPKAPKDPRGKRPKKQPRDIKHNAMANALKNFKISE